MTIFFLYLLYLKKPSRERQQRPYKSSTKPILNIPTLLSPFLHLPKPLPHHLFLPSPRLPPYLPTYLPKKPQLQRRLPSPTNHMQREHALLHTLQAAMIIPTDHTLEPLECIDQRALPAAVAVSHAFEVEVGKAVGLDGFLGDARPEHGVSVGAS